MGPPARSPRPFYHYALNGGELIQEDSDPFSESCHLRRSHRGEGHWAPKMMVANGDFLLFVKVSIITRLFQQPPGLVSPCTDAGWTGSTISPTWNAKSGTARARMASALLTV